MTFAEHERDMWCEIAGFELPDTSYEMKELAQRARDSYSIGNACSNNYYHDAYSLVAPHLLRELLAYPIGSSEYHIADASMCCAIHIVASLLAKGVDPRVAATNWYLSREKERRAGTSWNGPVDSFEVERGPLDLRTA